MTKKFEAITQLPKQALEKINIKKRLLQEDVAEDLRENLIEKDLVGIAPHWQEGQAGSTSQAPMVLAQADGAAGAAADAAGGAAGAAGAGAGAAGMSTAAAASAANASFGGLAGMAGVSSGVTALAGGVAGLGVAVSVASAQKPVADTTAPTVSPVADTTAPAAPSVAEHGTSDLSDNVLNKAESVSTIFRVTLPTTGSQALAGDSLELLLDGSTFGTAKTVILTSTDISNGYVDFTVRRADLGADGAKALSAKITDVAGNVGPDSSALNFMLDTSGRYITVGSAAIWEDTDQDGVQDSDETQTYTLDANNQLQDANGLVDFSKEQVTIRFTDVTRGVLDVTGFDANDKIQIDRAAGLANFMGLKQFLSANTLSGVDPTGNPANYGAIFARPATRTAASGAYHTYFANSEYATPNLAKMTRYIALSSGFISPTSTKLFAYGSERIGFDPAGILGLRSLARKTTYMEFLRGLPATAHGQVEYLLPKTVIEQGSSDLSDEMLNAAESATTNFRVTLPANGTQAMGDSLELLLDGNAFGTAKTVILTSTDISNGYVDFTVLRADLGADGAKALRATITDASGQSGADSTTLKFTLDTHAPTLLTTSPLDDATSVAPASDIVLTFSETVIAGAGNIVISNGTDTRTIDVTDTSQVTIIGDTVTINPTTDLNASSSYHVHVDAGALINNAGNVYVGISNDTDLNFATGVADTTAPSVSSVAITSATGALNSKLNAGDVVTATVTMSEATTVTGTPQLALNIGGTTVYADYASGSGTTALLFTYTILAGQTDANGISIAANSLALNSGTLTDAASNNATLTHSLVADNSSYLVDTTAPTLASSTPADGATAIAVASNIVLTFSETVLAGTGNIVISNGTDTRTISVSDSQVTISGNTVTINPSTDLTAGSNYHVKVDSTALKDSAGNDFAGISNSTDLNFSTAAASSKLYYTVGMINGAAAVWKEDVDTSTGSFLSGTEGVFDGNDTRLQANDFSGNGFKQITAANASVNDVTVRFNIANGELLDLSGFGAGDKVIIDMKTHMSSFMGIPGFATATNVRNTINFINANAPLNQGVQAQISVQTYAGGPRTIITAKVTFNVGAYTGPLPGRIAYSGALGRPNNDYGIVAVGFSPLSTLQYILP